MKRLRKLKNRAGFSLAETLMAVLILLMVSMIVATGIPAAKNAYEKTVIGANAQAMLSTAVSALRDELGTAWDIVIDGDATKTSGTSVTYTKADTGAQAKIQLDGKAASLQDFVALDFIHDRTAANLAQGNLRPLVPYGASDLYVTYTNIQYDRTKGILTITGLRVCKQLGDVEVANLGKDTGGKAINLEIRVLSAKAA